MLRWCVYLSGLLLIGVALAAAPSGAVVESYVGGSAVHGSVEDGHYFVDPGHGRPIAEVSESTWRTVLWVERLWPFSILVPGLIGLVLVTAGKGPNWKPLPPPPKEMPPWMIWACGASGALTVAETYVFWVVVHVPWATMLAGWTLVCVNGGAVIWLYIRFLRRQPISADPDFAPDSDLESEIHGSPSERGK